jgi:ribosomal protein S4
MAKFKLYKRYYCNIWGEVSVRKRFIKIGKILSGSRPRVNEAFFLRKLQLRPDLRQPIKKRKKVSLRQRMYRMRQILKRFYGNFQERKFKQLIKRVKRKSGVKLLVGQLERRLDVLLFRVSFVKSILMAQQWIINGYVKVNDEVILNYEYLIAIGDVVSLSFYKYTDVVSNLLVRIYGRNLVLPLKKYYEINYKCLELCLIKEPLEDALVYPMNIDGSAVLISYSDE